MPDLRSVEEVEAGAIFGADTQPTGGEGPTPSATHFQAHTLMSKA